MSRPGPAPDSVSRTAARGGLADASRPRGRALGRVLVGCLARARGRVPAHVARQVAAQAPNQAVVPILVPIRGPILVPVLVQVPVLALVLGLVLVPPPLLPGLRSTALAGEALPGPREVWLFTDGQTERRVDVTDLPTEVREEVVRRLEAQGFLRAIPGPDGGTPPRDLEADVGDLVRHGGRFPPRPDAGEGVGDAASLARRILDLASVLARWKQAGPDSGTRDLADAWAALLARSARPDALGRALGALLPSVRYALGQAGEALPHAGRDPGPPAPGGLRFLGARAVLEEGRGLVLADVPPESLAVRLGLVRGDAVEALDGAAPRATDLAAWAGPPLPHGQRALRVRRREGRIEAWEIWFAPAPAPPGPRLPLPALPPDRR